MTGSDTGLAATHRIRRIVDDNVVGVVVALVVLALVGGYVTYATHVDPGTTVEQRQVASWESTGEFTHRATVVNDTDAFARGTVLRNRSTYFSRVSPALNGSFAYAYAASDGGNLTVETDVALVIRSVPTEEGRADETEYWRADETEYWRVEEPLGSERVRSLAPGQTARVPFSVNVPAARDRAAAVSDQLGADPGETRLSLVARVDLSGTRNGRTVDRTRRYRMPLSVDGGLYSVGDPGPVTDSDGRTERATVPATYGPARRIGGPALLALGVVGLAALGTARRRGTLSVSDAERRQFDHARTREAFDEWITTGRVPGTARRRPWVEVDSLEGLVDVAIDANRRVIEDAERGEFAVLDDGVGYLYRPPDALARGPHLARSDGRCAPAGPDENGDSPGADADPSTDASARRRGGRDAVADDGPASAVDGDLANAGDGGSAAAGDDGAAR